MADVTYIILSDQELHKVKNETVLNKNVSILQGGIQATEAMLYTLDYINANDIIPGVKLGVHIKDDCDDHIYGLEQSLDFIKGIQKE